MRIFATLSILLFICISVQAQELNDYLFPAPKEVKYATGNFNEVQGATFSSNEFYSVIKKSLAFNIKGELKVLSSPLTNNTFKLSIDSTLTHLQQYKLTIDSTNITITGKDEAALYYGKQTLLQIIKYSQETGQATPCLTINDWPDFERRGYMLDISRDKVPTMETLYHIIDLLASWKINEFQLYTEHTFAYQNHKKVWEEASPMTPKEITQIDAYCKAKFIDLVPNQNSFGHMENWLKHDEYLHLAECPTDCDTKWGTRSRHSLNPLNPESFDLMKELYTELLPNFSSEYFNIGCDETVELGNGLSKKTCKKQGVGNVYLDYVKKLNSEANINGKKAQFWGDIILNHSELISEIPKNMTAMVWGYESTYPFQENLPKFKDAGLDFYVCPGTSTWRSEIGRNKDAFINLKQAAVYGSTNKAKGYLNTNWGDWGHWQPLSVCYPAMAVGSAYSWNSESNPTAKLAPVLSNYIFEDKTDKLSEALLKLGNAYLACDIQEGNANAFHLMLRRYRWTMKGHYQTKMLTSENLLKAKKEIKLALELLDSSEPKGYKAEVILEELKQAANLAIHGINLGLARLEAENYATENIDSETRKKLAQELEELIINHKKLWVIRNRKGGLQLSSEKLTDLLEYYQTQEM
ncbi:beta-N-acetylhexosaminidase [Labilibacter marinus]|uniref:beta-N-acetylhexosaminidase n=1 Tax=Labilibacter marinus TaxID=1477105 RepID=UPI0008332582|nr:family 20 glycosylhydrolase [Labilibacter marinus]